MAPEAGEAVLEVWIGWKFLGRKVLVVRVPIQHSRAAGLLRVKSTRKKIEVGGGSGALVAMREGSSSSELPLSPPSPKLPPTPSAQTQRSSAPPPHTLNFTLFLGGCMFGAGKPAGACSSQAGGGPS